MTSENCDHSTAFLMENFSVRVSNISSTECLGKASSGAQESQNKTGFESHIPRSSLAISNSCNDASKNNLSSCKGRPSMIPKSKSIKRTEKGNVKFEMSVQSEEICIVGKSNKKQLTNKTEKEPDEPEKTETIKKQVDPSEKVEREDIMNLISIAKTESKEEAKQLEMEMSSLSLKSCVTTVDIKEEKEEEVKKDSDYSATSMKSQLSEYRDAEEYLNNSITFDYEFSRGEKGNDEKEAERQERGIQTLYETLRSTGPLFDNFKFVCEKYPQDYTSTEDWQNYSVQHCYDMTLEEISDIWKNTMSLISSVKDHAIKFIEKKKEANSLDREQLVLEGEMVQLAIDFAINYSKLKTDFLIKSVSERLGVEYVTKSSLEGFMDSKTLAPLYNDDDLATMSRTIKDLNTNVLKDEDLEVQ